MTRAPAPRLLAPLLLALAAPVSVAAAADPPLLPALEALAAKGSADATYHLGMMYLLGQGVAVDRQRALALFRDAAARGQPLAAYKLGCLYAGQYGVVAPNEPEALRWKLVGAEAGYALAQHDVAGIYARRGDGARAVAWMTRAAAQGEPASLGGMVALHDPARGLVRDGAVAVAYLSLLADRGNVPPAARTEVDRHRAALSPAERTRADAIAAGYRARPTPLTLEARSGDRAAKALVAAR